MIDDLDCIEATIDDRFGPDEAQIRKDYGAPPMTNPTPNTTVTPERLAELRGYCNHFEHVTVESRVVTDLITALEAERAKVQRLERKHQIKSEYCEKYHAYCPDCRDKLEPDHCMRCENQKLKAENERLRDALQDYLYWSGPPREKIGSPKAYQCGGIGHCREVHYSPGVKKGSPDLGPYLESRKKAELALQNKSPDSEAVSDNEQALDKEA